MFLLVLNIHFDTALNFQKDSDYWILEKKESMIIAMYNSEIKVTPTPVIDSCLEESIIHSWLFDKGKLFVMCMVPPAGENPILLQCRYLMFQSLIGLPVCEWSLVIIPGS